MKHIRNAAIGVLVFVVTTASSCVVQQNGCPNGTHQGTLSNGERVCIVDDGGGHPTNGFDAAGKALGLK